MSELTSPAVTALQKASEGLLFSSETDAPLVPFFWPDEQNDVALTSERLSASAHLPAATPIQATSVAAFFRDTTTEEEWHNEEERAEVARFRELVKVIKSTLQRPQAFRVGETNITVYIVGGVVGGWAGLQTQVVET